jgi:hypothetical protein
MLYEVVYYLKFININVHSSYLYYTSLGVCYGKFKRQSHSESKLTDYGRGNHDSEGTLHLSNTILISKVQLIL